ncbi:unnamed protein product [Chironomus riparius]|uniref:Uncharacterized protein n=1 Tax=Chironomus riparius TaxID=315576 RepID=A0A9N9S3A5_9DIPT|nr:unnamed protein product [Chironomus riparius]
MHLRFVKKDMLRKKNKRIRLSVSQCLQLVATCSNTPPGWNPLTLLLFIFNKHSMLHNKESEKKFSSKFYQIFLFETISKYVHIKIKQSFKNLK